MLPDDDKQYAIETSTSSESVLKKWFKNKLHTISAFVGCVIIIEANILFTYCPSVRVENMECLILFPSVYTVNSAGRIN